MFDTLFNAITRTPSHGMRWRAHCSEDVRRVVVDLRAFLKEVVAAGGLETRRYLTPERKSAEDELGDLTGRVHDRTLRSACERIAHEYRYAFASAPANVGPRIYSMTGPINPAYVEQDRAYEEQRAREVEHARAALVAIDDALARLNKLERFVIKQ